MNSVKSEFIEFRIEYGTNSNSKLKSKSVENSDTKILKNSDFKVPNYRFRFRFTPLAPPALSAADLEAIVSQVLVHIAQPFARALSVQVLHDLLILDFVTI